MKKPANSKEIKDQKAFIFSISNCKKFHIKKNECAFLFQADNGPIFGGARSDIYVNLDFTSNHTNFGRSYQLPDGVDYQSKEAKEYLAGEEKFEIEELEVF